jgi:hypothetical protein
MGIRLTDAAVYLTTNDDRLKSGLDAGKRQVDGWGSAINGMLMGAGMAAFNAIASVAQGTVAYLGDSVAAASDLNETVSKVETLFGSSSVGIMQWAQNSATAMGLPKQAALDAVGTIGNLFMQLGASSDEAAGVGQNMVQLSADLASFHNVAGGSAEVLDAMSAAFRGEYDALQRYIPTINGAAVEQQALAMTGKESAKELTNLEKAMAVQAIMARDAGAAMGDFARTSGGLANQQRILDAQMADLQATVGAALLPVMTTLTTLLNQMVQAVLPPLTAFITDRVVPAMAAIGAVIDATVGPMIEAAMGWFAGLGTTVQAQTNGPLNFFNGWIAENMPRIQQIVSNVLTAITGFWNEHGAAIVAAVQTYFGWMMDFWSLVFRTLLNIAQVFLQVLTGDWEGAGKTLQGIVRDWWTTLRRIFSDMIASIVQLWRSVDWGGIGRAIVDGIWSGLRAAWGGLQSWFGDRLQEWRNMLPFSEPKDPSSPLRGLAKAGEAIVDQVRTGIDRAADWTVPALALPQVQAAGAPIEITINISGVPDAQAAGRASKDGVLAGLRAAGYR